MVTPAFLPYGRQLIEDDDVAAVAAALRADYLTTGPRVETFERAFADRVGAAHAVACSSGTAALHLAAIALGLGPGDWLVVPSMTFLATANAARFVGAEVQFADVDADTGLITEATLGEALDPAKRAGRKVKAVSVVHLAGRTAPMRAIAARMRTCRSWRMPATRWAPLTKMRDRRRGSAMGATARSPLFRSIPSRPSPPARAGW